MRAKLNSPLVEWLKEHSAPVMQAKRRSRSVVYRATKWRLKDRLTEVHVVRMSMTFQTGMTTKAIAERYGINVKSVRKTLRAHGLPTARIRS